MIKNFQKICNLILPKKSFNVSYSVSYLDLVFLFLAFSLGIYLSWTAIDSLFLTFVVLTVLYPFPGKQLAKLSLLLLVAVPLLEILKRVETAEQFGIYAFYTLIMTTIMVIVEYQDGKGE